MLVRMKAGASPSEIEQVENALRQRGRTVRKVDRVLLVSGSGGVDPGTGMLPGVEAVLEPDTEYRLVHRQARPGGTRVRVGSVEIGGGEFVMKRPS